jgi:hypothetical protein
MQLRRTRQKEEFPYVGGGGRQDGDPSQPHPPQEADSCQKLADLGQRGILPREVGPKVTKDQMWQVT